MNTSVPLVLRAMAFGCAAASAIITIALAIFTLATSDGLSAEAPVAFLFWFGLCFAATMVVALTAGLAWHSLCQLRGWRNIHAYWLAGAFVGGVLGGIWFIPAGVALIGAYLAALGAALGGLTGAFAWLIRRPDRDGPNPPTPAP